MNNNAPQGHSNFTDTDKINQMLVTTTDGIEAVNTSKRVSVKFKPYIPFDNSLLPVHEIPFDDIPNFLSNFIKEKSLTRGCSPDFILVSLLARIGCVIAGKIQIVLTRKTGWLASPNFFWLMIGDPSSGKTNALGASDKGIQLLQRKAQDEYREDIKKYNLQKELLNTKLKANKKGLENEVKKAKPNQVTVNQFENCIRSLTKELNELEKNRPKRKTYTINKTTLEKFLLILDENPYGVMLEADELSSLFVRLSKDDHIEERTLYLSGFSNQPFSYDTIKRGNVVIPKVTLSILGGIQPSKLKRFTDEAKTGYQDDGLLQRFQGTVFPDKHTQSLEDRELSPTLEEDHSNLFSNLDNIAPDTVLSLNEEAQKIYDEWRNKNEKIAQSLCHPLGSHLAKSYEFVASLAVYLYLLENNGQITIDKEISKLNVLNAIKLGDYFFSHAKRMYGLTYQDNLPARSLAEKILKFVEKPAEHYDGEKQLYYFTKSHIRTKDWSNLKTKEERQEALQDLIQNGHIYKCNNKYFINPEHLNE